MTNNPRISLDLVGVSALEAMAALSKAADIPVRYPETGVLAKIRHVQDALPRLEEPADFPWHEHTFAQAVRDLCYRYQLSPTQYVDGHYELLPCGNGGAAEDAVPLPDFEQNGVRIYPEAVNQSQQRSMRFRHTSAGSQALVRTFGERNHLFISVGVQVDGWDVDRLAMVEGWTAEDDRGHRLEPLVRPEETERWEFRYWTGSRFGSLPDEWGTSAMLEAPSLGASRLRYLTGDLLAFQRLDYRTLEFPVPLSGEVQRTVDGVHVEIKRFENEEPDESDDLGNSDSELRGPLLQARVRKPKGTVISSPGQVAGIRPSLIGVSGRKYAFRRRTLEDASNPGEEVTKITTRFAASDDPPARIVFELLIKSQPEKLLTFCLRDIPLP